MAKKLIRVAAPDIPKRLEELREREIHIVLLSGAVRLGVIRELKEDVIIFYNLKKHKISVPLNQVQEVIYDRLST